MSPSPSARTPYHPYIAFYGHTLHTVHTVHTLHTVHTVPNVGMPFTSNMAFSRSRKAEAAKGTAAQGIPLKYPSNSPCSLSRETKMTSEGKGGEGKGGEGGVGSGNV